MSLTPSSPAPGLGAANEPPTFREARDLLSSLSTTITARGPRSLAEARAVQLGARMVRRGARGRRAWPKIALKVIGERVETRTFAELTTSRRVSPTACARSAPGAAIAS